MKSGAKQVLAGALFLSLALGAFAAKEAKGKAEAHSRFDQFKALAGEWVGTAAMGEQKGGEAHITYKVTSLKSAVVETAFPNTDHEMVTIITRDGDDIALTHYCALGNQPHMKAPDKDTSDAVAFKFVSAGNLKSEKSMHMHNVTYTFVDKDTLKQEWTNYMDGKAAGSATFILKRKK